MGLIKAQAFCWLCGAATGMSHTWTEISGHSCGRYKDEADRRIDEAQRNVKRYTHYYTRWCAAVPLIVDYMCPMRPSHFTPLPRRVLQSREGNSPDHTLRSQRDN